jgi:hypothetical protein
VKELKRERKLKLPGMSVVLPICMMLNETINTEPLTKEEYSQAFYMMLKSRIDRMSRTQYEDFLEIVE